MNINITLSMVIDLFAVFWQIIKSLWFVWIAALVVGLTPILIDFLFRKIEEIKWRRWLEKHKKLEDWKKLSGRDFEKIVAQIYRNLGYKTKIIGGAGDRGIDIIIAKDNKRVFVQCKRMEAVPPRYIREFYGSIADRLKENESGFFVTTGGFTEEGKKFAEGKPISLIDGLNLEKLAEKQ